MALVDRLVQAREIGVAQNLGALPAQIGGFIGQA